MTAQLRDFKPESILFDLEDFEVGAGTYGKVIVGHNEVHDFVAVKCMAIQGGNDDKTKIEEIIKDELALLQKAKHDNITNVYGYTKWPFAMGLVMEYYRGGNLRQLLLNDRVNVGVLLRLRILAEGANGVVYIHNLFGKRLVHGDLKPDNMLLTVDFHCKIGDFGSAKMIRCTSAGSTTALPTNYHGTEAYTAPERLLDRGIRPKKEHDTYSFGIITYVVVIRDHPYQELVGLAGAVIEGQRPSLERLEEAFWNLDANEATTMALMATTMQKCWQHESADRPSMKKVRDAFQQHLETQDEIKLMEDVAIASRMTSARPERDRKRCRTPLSQFSPLEGQFQGTAGRTMLQQFIGRNGRRRLQIVSVPILLSIMIIFPAIFYMYSDSRAEQRELARKFVSLLRDSEYAQADETKSELSTLLRADNVTHSGVWAQAEDHRAEGNHLEAILFYQISSEFVSNRTHPDEEAWEVRKTVWGIMETNKELVKTDKEAHGGVITVEGPMTDYIVPAMNAIRLRIAVIKNVSVEKQVLCQAWCFHYIEWSQFLIEDYTAMNMTLFLGVEMMERRLGSDAAKHKVYAHLKVYAV